MRIIVILTLCNDYFHFLILLFLFLKNETECVLEKEPTLSIVYYKLHSISKKSQITFFGLIQ